MPFLFINFGVILSVYLSSKLQEFRVLCALMNSRQLVQCQTCSGCSINIFYIINEDTI